jgi:hypothetical protein
VAISELPVVRKAGGQFLENLVRLGSKVVIDGTALPPEPHDQEMCPAHDDRSSKSDHLFGSPPLQVRTVEPGAPRSIDQHSNLFNPRGSSQFRRRQHHPHSV